jgi:hypothetical protein
MGGYICLGVFVLFLLAAIIDNNRRQRELEKARIAYQRCLSRLKADPTNANLRQQTLQLGRVYSHLTRDKKGVTLFDEVALMNDINAACAGAATLRNVQVANVATQPVEERLNKLAALKAKGLIDEAEYQARRQKILDEV